MPLSAAGALRSSKQLGRMKHAGPYSSYYNSVTKVSHFYPASSVSAACRTEV